MAEKTIGHYRIVDTLGAGGMGVVYRAEDLALHRPVALKFLARDIAADEEARARFLREARIAAKLNHPNTCTVYEVGETGGTSDPAAVAEPIPSGTPFIAMELIDGETMAEWLSRAGRIPVGDALNAAIQIAEGLAEAHAQGIVHRDLKPHNVMVTGRGRVKILDFGLAKPFGSARQALSGLTTDDALSVYLGHVNICGTFQYMSPEQALGKAVDTRSDIFAFGIMLYEMVSGDRPFRGETATAVIAKIIEAEPPPLPAGGGAVPQALVRIICRCLQKKPEERYNDTRDLVIDLDEVRRHLGSVPTPSGVIARVSSGSSEAARSRRGIGTRTRAALLVIGVALFNWIETAVETLVSATTGAGADLRQELARSMQWLEAGASFERHELTDALAIYGYSVAYFFLMPVLVLAALTGFARRSDPRAFRVLCLALACDYAISLPFYVFYPVPERWAFPESEAVLLSDLWSAHLIEVVRPISAIDNCFPSFHVSATVVVVLAAFLFRARYRTLAVPLGLLVIASAFVLGIHWLADLAAGAASGIISLWLAVRTEAALTRRAWCAAALPAPVYPPPSGAGSVDIRGSGASAARAGGSS